MHRRNKQSRIALIILVPFTTVLFLSGLYFLPDLPSSTIEKERFWANKVSQRQVYDIVYTGDSRVYRGIDPKIIETTTGLKGYNYGFSSAGLTRQLLRNAAGLLRNDGPKILVVGASVNSFLPSALANEHLSTWLGKDSRDIFVKTRIYPLLKGFDAYAISDFYKYLKGESYTENFYPESGFVASGKNPADSASAILPYLEQFQKETPDLEAVDAFISCLSELKQQGIRIILVRIPVTREMATLEEVASLGLPGQIRNRVRNRGIEYPEPDWGLLYSYDGSHLEAGSARLYSQRLAAYLAQNH